jgi:hypothetical protein
MVVSCVSMYGIGFGCGFKYISLWKDLKILGLIKINIFIIIKIIIYYLFTPPHCLGVFCRDDKAEAGYGWGNGFVGLGRIPYFREFFF